MNGHAINGDASAATEIDLLVVGAGPAGAALACFLASHGLKGLMISAAPGTAQTPRAHITNPAALECLRDIGIEDECLQMGQKNEDIGHTRWSHSMTGEEYARIYAWGHDPARQAKGDHDAASPCRHIDLPQTRLEPILVKYASHHGFTCRFDTSFLHFERTAPDCIVSTVKDNITNQTYRIKSKYLFGCDGGRSKTMKQLQIPLIKGPGGGFAFNVLLKADLSPYMEHRKGTLHFVFRPDLELPPWARFCIARMVKPWTEWLFVYIAAPGVEITVEPTRLEWEQQVRNSIGSDSIPFEILDVSPWRINDLVGESFSDGNIFCLGDAVHRHPPFKGLGSNTCIQDAYNLAWKIAYVTSHAASPSLLSTYSHERQPIGAGVVQSANNGLVGHGQVWDMLGVLCPTVAERLAVLKLLGEATPKGRERRMMLSKAVESTEKEFSGVGIEMNQRYESAAIYTADEREPRSDWEEREEHRDSDRDYAISTYPGSRLPHVWVNTKIPGAKKSTQDLAGKGRFVVFTGIGGEAWRDAARVVGEEIGLEIGAVSIGWDCDWEDIYRDWDRRREIEDDGCLLIRPDRVVCWRSMRMVEGCAEKFGKVMKSVLGIESG